MDVYPLFELAEADYPVQLRAEPGPLNRLAVLFRITPIIPAVIIRTVLAYGLSFPVLFVAWLIGAHRRPDAAAAARGARGRPALPRQGNRLLPELTAAIREACTVTRPAPGSSRRPRAGFALPGGACCAQPRGACARPARARRARVWPAGVRPARIRAPAGGGFDYDWRDGAALDGTRRALGYGQPPPGTSAPGPAGNPGAGTGATPGHGLFVPPATASPPGYPAGAVRGLGGDQPRRLVRFPGGC